MTEEVLSLNRFVFDVRTVMVTLDMTYGLWNFMDLRRRKPVAAIRTTSFTLSVHQSI